MVIYSVNVSDTVKFIEINPFNVSAYPFPFIESLFLSFLFIMFFGLFINALYDFLLLYDTKIEASDKIKYRRVKLLTLLFLILMGLTAYLLYEFIYLPYGRELFITYFHT